MSCFRCRHPYLLCGLAAVCFVYFIFSVSLDFDFINWDDSIFIADNPDLDFTWKNLRLYFSAPFQDICSPLTLVSFMFDHAMIPGSAYVCRLHNLVLHLVSMLLLFGIGKELHLSPLTTLLVTLLWAVNPQKVESVCWITERKDVLCGVFAFAAVYAFLCAVRKKRLPWLASVFCVLSILAKPASLSIAGILFLYLACRWRRKHSIQEYIRFFAPVVLLNLIVICYSFIITFQTNPGHVSFKPLVPLHNIFWYPVTSFLPFLPMTPCAVYPEVPIFGKAAIATFTIGFILFITGVMIARFLRRPIPRIYAAGWILAVLCIIFPVAGLLDYTNFTHCDRYNYIVSAAVLFGIASFLTYCLQDAAIRNLKIGEYATFCTAITSAILVCIFSANTLAYIPKWESAEKLFRSVLEQSIRYGYVPPNIHTVQNSIELWLNNENEPEHRILVDILLESFPPDTWNCYADEPGKPVTASLMLARMHQMESDNPEAQAMCRELFSGITEHRYALFSSLSETYLEDMIRFFHAEGNMTRENEMRDALLRYHEQHSKENCQ